MSYIVEQDIIDELGEAKLIQLTDNNRTGEIDHVKVNKAISFAVGTFDSYARTRYKIPVPLTELVKSRCLDLAIFKLKRDRATGAESIEKLMTELYNPAIKFLEAIQSGKAALDVPSSEETATNPGSPDQVLSGSKNPLFTDDNLKGY